MCVQPVCSQSAAGKDHPHHQRSDQHYLQWHFQPLCSGEMWRNVCGFWEASLTELLIYFTDVTPVAICTCPKPHRVVMKCESVSICNSAFVFAGPAAQRPGERVCSHRLWDLQRATRPAEIIDQSRGEGEKRDEHGDESRPGLVLPPSLWVTVLPDHLQVQWRWSRTFTVESVSLRVLQCP